MTRLLRFLPMTRRIGVWLRTHRLVPSRPGRFRILIADLEGDEPTLGRTRHLEEALRDQMDLAILPVGPGQAMNDGVALERYRSTIACQNGDSLIFGAVNPESRRMRIQTLGRYERKPGCHGPYQTGWTELPEAFGGDADGLLQTLILLSLSPAARSDRDRAHMINDLRPAAARLTRLLEEPGPAMHSERQGVFWHALGLAASLLGEHTRSQRWLEVAVHAQRTALLVWQKNTLVVPWAIVQNNLGHALRLLAEQHQDRRKKPSLLEQSVDAFQEAIRVYRTDAATLGYLRRTEANLAHAEGLLRERPLAA